MEGFDETVKAFQEISDGMKKVRLIRKVQDRAAVIYLNVVKQHARNAANFADDDLARSFGKKTTKKMKRAGFKHKGWIDSRYGASNRKDRYGQVKGKRLTFAAQAAIFAEGTEERRHKKGKYVGRIEGTDFIEKAWNKSKGAVAVKYKLGLMKMMRTQVRKAGMAKALR